MLCGISKASELVWALLCITSGRVCTFHAQMLQHACLYQAGLILRFPCLCAGFAWSSEYQSTPSDERQGSRPSGVAAEPGYLLQATLSLASCTAGTEQQAKACSATDQVNSLAAALSDLAGAPAPRDPASSCRAAASQGQAGQAHTGSPIQQHRQRLSLQQSPQAGRRASAGQSQPAASLTAPGALAVDSVWAEMPPEATAALVPHACAVGSPEAATAAVLLSPRTATGVCGSGRATRAAASPWQAMEGKENGPSSSASRQSGHSSHANRRLSAVASPALAVLQQAGLIPANAAVAEG